MDDISDLLVSLGQRVSVLRRVRKLRQEDAARAAGVSRSTLCDIEKGSGRVEMGNYLRVLQALGVLHDVNRVAEVNVAAIAQGVGRRVSRGRTLPLPPDHRDQKTREQQAFLRSGHPGAYGFWNHPQVKVLSVPDIEDSTEW